MPLFAHPEGAHQQKRLRAAVRLAPRATCPGAAVGLLLRSLPDAMPVGGGGIDAEECDPLLEQSRRTVLGRQLETLLELPLSEVPVTLAVGRQTRGKQVTELERVWR